MLSKLTGKELISVVKSSKQKAKKLAIGHGFCATGLAGCLAGDVFVGASPAQTTITAIMTAIASLIYPYCPNIASAMASQLKYDINTKLDDINFNVIKEGHLIDKENIKPVFLRIDSELADKGKK